MLIQRDKTFERKKAMLFDTSGRDDCTTLLIPTDWVGYVTGVDRPKMGQLEEDNGVLMFFSKPHVEKESEHGKMVVWKTLVIDCRWRAGPAAGRAHCDSIRPPAIFGILGIFGDFL